MVYLTDQIAGSEEKPQLYRTRFDLKGNAKPNPNFFDDLNRSNERRTSIGPKTLEGQTKPILGQVKEEKLGPPADFGKRKQGYKKGKKLLVGRDKQI